MRQAYDYWQDQPGSNCSFRSPAPRRQEDDGGGRRSATGIQRVLIFPLLVTHRVERDTRKTRTPTNDRSVVRDERARSIEQHARSRYVPRREIDISGLSGRSMETTRDRRTPCLEITLRSDSIAGHRTLSTRRHSRAASMLPPSLSPPKGAFRAGIHTFTPTDQATRDRADEERDATTKPTVYHSPMSAACVWCREPL